MNMIKEIIGSIAHSSLFGVIGTVITFMLFVIIVVWTIRLDKRYVENMRQMPLESAGDAGIEENHG